MQKEPLISIIINCFNGQEFLKEALESVIYQTYQNWEVIFWDNASSDRSIDIASSFLDERIKIFRSQVTTPLGEARNLAAEMAKGDFLQFLDVDDFFEKNNLSEKIYVINNSQRDVHLIFSAVFFLYQDTGAVQKQYISNWASSAHSVKLQRLLEYDYIPFASALISKDIFTKLGGFNNEYKHSPDYDLFIRIFRHVEVCYLSLPLTYIRRHRKNLSKSSLMTCALENILILEANKDIDKNSRGIQSQRANLFLVYLKEKKFICAVKLILVYLPILPIWRQILRVLVSSRSIKI